MKSIVNKRTPFQLVIFASVFILYFLYAIIIIYPFIWMILNSFKSNGEFIADIWGLPAIWRFNNYKDAFSIEILGSNLFTMFTNSSILLVGCTTISLMSNLVTGYVVAKYKFVGKDFLYSFMIIVMMVPMLGSLSATYKLINDLGIFDTYFALFLMSSNGFGMGFLMIHAFFKNVSWSYAESAFVDGASDFKVFLKIMLPQARPILLTYGIITAVGVWNDYFTPFMFLPNYSTVATGMQEFYILMTQQQNWPILFSIMTISIIPVIIVYSIFSKTMMNNMSLGGLKG